jgi:hypothetical protein
MIRVDVFELCKHFRCSRRSITFLEEVVSCHVPAKSICSTRSITFRSKLSYFHVLFHSSSIGINISKSWKISMCYTKIFIFQICRHHLLENCIFKIVENEMKETTIDQLLTVWM